MYTLGPMSPEPSRWLWGSSCLSATLASGCSPSPPLLWGSKSNVGHRDQTALGWLVPSLCFSLERRGERRCLLCWAHSIFSTSHVTKRLCHNYLKARRTPWPHRNIFGLSVKGWSLLVPPFVGFTMHSGYTACSGLPPLALCVFGQNMRSRLYICKECIELAILWAYPR